MKANNNRISIGYIFFLCFIVAIYSSASFFTKLASGYEFLTFPFILCIGGVVMVLGIYAILWQIVLRKVALNKAYMFRSLGVLYGLAIAYYAFHESITIFNLLGCGLVVIGLSVLLNE